MKKWLSISLVLMVIGLASLVPPLPARAAGTVGDGTPGSCTEAAFDSALAGGGLVDFNCGGSPVTITLTSQKTISADTTIDGANLVTLSGGNSTRLFMVNLGTSLNLEDLILTNGSNSQGGAIYNDGTLMINNSLFSNNAALGGLGGAINNPGTLSIANSTFVNNFAGLIGGSLLNNGTATILSCNFINNQSADAGAIYNNGSMTIARSNFIDNTTTGGAGAGIYNDANDAVYTSVFSGNTTTGGSGGGLYNVIYAQALVSRSSFINNGAPGSFGGGIANEGQLTILTDVFTGNYASAALGGGIYSTSTNPTDITNSTFSSNFGGLAGGGLYISGPATVLNSTFFNNYPDGLSNNGTGEVNVKNTILASNSPVNCLGVNVTSLGNNLEDGSTCAFSGPGDLSNTDPMLGPLADNGGSTQTHALLYGSPAINAGTNDGCPLTDQRGVKRPLLGTCDIGAYEYGYVIQLPIIRK